MYFGETNLAPLKSPAPTDQVLSIIEAPYPIITVHISMRRPEEDVPDVKEGEGEKCLNEVTPKRNVELHVHVVPDLDHCEFAIATAAAAA